MRTRPSPHWRGLDGLRALAVGAVVAYHFAPASLPGGFLGVDVFFGISGYLITRLLAEEFLANGHIDVVHFYGRRARRLLPALVVLLVAVAAGALIWRDQLATVRGGVLAAAGFGANWWLAFDHQSYFVSAGRPSMLQHLWSLGVEEQFYLLWPLLTAMMLAAARRAGNGRITSVRRAVGRLSLLAATLAVASTALMWTLADRHDVPYGNDGSTLYFGTHTHCMGLLLGAALGAWAAAGSSRPPRARWVERGVDVLGAAALVVLAVLTKRLADYSLSLYRGDFFAVGVLVVVAIAVATRRDSVLGRVLDAPILRWVGVRSYSIYLWHWPIAIITRPGIDTTMPLWLDQILRIALTLGLSDLTYRFIEEPVRRRGPRAVLSPAAARVRAQWRRLPPRLNVAAPVSFVALSVVAVAVIVIGPAAPRPSAAAGVGPGGQHLALTRDPRVAPVGGGRGATPLPKLSAFGDSVLLGARRPLGQLFAGGSIDAVESRQPAPILADVRAAARTGSLAPLVVLHLGNNGLISPNDLQQTLQALASVKVVLVVNDHLDPYDRSWQKPNNATIDTIVPRFANARIVDWDRLAAAHRGWLYPDDVHLKPAGASAYADVLATAYRSAIVEIRSQP